MIIWTLTFEGVPRILRWAWLNNVMARETRRKFVTPTFGASPCFKWPHPTLIVAPHSVEWHLMCSHAEMAAHFASQRASVEYFSHCQNSFSVISVQCRINIQGHSSWKNTFIRKSGWSGCSSNLSTPLSTPLTLVFVFPNYFLKFCPRSFIMLSVNLLSFLVGFNANGKGQL